MQIPSSDLAACQALLRQGSRSFHAASLLLPARVHAPAAALYGFCRLADDAVDCPGAGPEALAQLQERLSLAYQGHPLPIAADRAFAEVIHRFRIPAALPEALLEGFAWDGEGRRYRNLAALYAYAARVAGTVGAMMALVMGVSDPESIARAADLGIAMQLSNIARDIGEDARAGRLYLPLDWLEEAGIDADRFLANPVFTPALGKVVARLIAAAERLYEQADSGIAALPWDCRPGIRAARYLYAGIGHEVARRGFDSVAGRAVLPAGRKLGAVAMALLPGMAGATMFPLNLPEAQFLIDAAAARPRPAAKRTLDDRIGWLVDLFGRLERQEQLSRSGR
jgi:phytoene synthase